MLRRSFLHGLTGVLAAGVAPSIVRASTLMPLRKEPLVHVPEKPILTPTTSPKLFTGEVGQIEGFRFVVDELVRGNTVYFTTGTLIRPDQKISGFLRTQSKKNGKYQVHVSSDWTYDLVKS